MYLHCFTKKIFKKKSHLMQSGSAGIFLLTVTDSWDENMKQMTFLVTYSMTNRHRSQNKVVLVRGLANIERL